MKYLIALTALALTACTGMSLESKADAAYGSFVVAEQAGATLMQNPGISVAAKEKIKSADAAAKPVADALLSAIQAYRTSPANSSGLQAALDIAVPAITTLATETKP